MAEVISKTSLFFGGACVNHHHADDFSVSPVSFGVKKSSSSLKLKPLRNDFYGKQILDTRTQTFNKSFHYLVTDINYN
ncbi:hypothetical protein Bca101_097999 [Brassica carinata]